MIRRGDQDEIQILLLQHLAIIAVSARALLRSLPCGDHVGRVRKHLLIDVAERNDLDRGDLDEAEEIGFAVPACADQADPFRFYSGEFSGVTSEG